MPLLQLNGLVVGHAGQALGGPSSLKLHGGEVVALLGPNGSGKTSLLKTLLGLLPPLAGQITVQGRPLATLTAVERAQLLAYVPQAVAQGFAFSVLEMVLMGRAAHVGLLGRPRREDRALAMACLDSMGIADLAALAYPQLSGGQQQLVLMARALTQQAQVLVLDEPAASLDFANQILLLERIASLRDSGRTVLFSSHQPADAWQVADRVALFRQGCIQDVLPTTARIDETRLAWLYDLDGDRLRAYLHRRQQI